MKEKELKRLNRAELLEMLVQMKKENDKLNAQLEDAEKQLKDRKIKISNAGSMAEAALQLNEVFKAADNAAAQYLESLQDAAANQREYRDRMLAETKKRCQKMLADTELQCQEKVKLTERQCSAMLRKLKAFCKAHPELTNAMMQSTRSEKNAKK